MDLTLYNIIGLAVTAALILGGIILKICLNKRTKDYEGFGGFVNPEEDSDASDDWPEI